MEIEKKIKCPWCGTELPSNKISRHMSTTCNCKPNGITEKELIDTIIICIYGNVIDDVINDYKNLYSLPDLRKKYGIAFRQAQRLLTAHGIEIRGISESAKQITTRKIKETCSIVYGVSNPSQLEEIKAKKKETFIKHYGVDNIWKTEEFKDLTRERWNSYNEEDKTRILKGIIYKHRTGEISKLEKRILCILKDIGIDFVVQFKIGKYFHKYDAKIVGTKTLLEINGDFWHANPKLYEPNDVLNFSKTNHPKAKDIWKKDEKNRKVAENNGYKVIYLWENEITNKTDIELGKFLIDKLNE